jgi:ABC-type transport system involved in multi-copper enzyme maturation permease subunit
VTHRTWVILAKEFREYRRNKLIVGTMAGLPILFLVITLIPLLTIPAQLADRTAPALVGQALLMFLLIPVVLPTTIAAYAVIGEREQGTLEPLLTTPATDQEILMGKAVAATAPGIVLTWGLFGVFAGILAAFARPSILEATLRPETFAAIGFLSPVLGVLAIELALIISSRSSDIRVAQQLSALSVLPAVVVSAVFAYGVIDPSPGRYALVAIGLAGRDVAGWRVVTSVFDRERVLTRYGG